MGSDQTRNTVWQNILDVARLVRYYETLADRHRFRHWMIRFLMLAAAAGGVAALLELLPSIAQLVAGGLIALLVVWDSISDYAKKAAVLHAISLECSAWKTNGANYGWTSRMRRPMKPTFGPETTGSHVEWMT